MPISEHTIAIVLQVFAHSLLVNLAKCFFFHFLKAISPVFFLFLLNSKKLLPPTFILFFNFLNNRWRTCGELILDIVSDKSGLCLFRIYERMSKMFFQTDGEAVNWPMDNRRKL